VFKAFRIGFDLSPHSRQRGFTRVHPVVNQNGVADKKGCHTQSGRIADAKVPLVVRMQWNESFRSTAAGDMFHKIVGECTDEINCEQFYPERSGHSRTFGNFGAVGDSKFAVAVNCRSAHQIADAAEQIEVRLESETLTGVFTDLDEDGALLLKTGQGMRKITAGDVFFPMAEAAEPGTD